MRFLAIAVLTAASATAAQRPITQGVLMIRDGWNSLPELGGVPRLDADVARARVVTLCIQEYYEPDRS